MNIQANDQNQSISDDQELAKALAGVNEEAGYIGLGQANPGGGLGQAPDTSAPEQFMQPAPQPAAPSASTDTPIDPALASVKQAALEELRPLVDKLDVNPEEKFNTYLLLIRSTDDKDLIAPAHEAAKNITDETKKAQALLDIIKEIDFLSNPGQ